LYLPIAEISVNAIALIALGLTAGFMSGLFGIGGGFLMTPALIFIGVPPAVAVASQGPQIIAASISSLDVQWRRGSVDVRIGLMLLAGGLIGSAAGVVLFGFLKSIGQIDIVIALAFVALLTAMGWLMLAESSRTIWRQRSKGPTKRRKLHPHYWVARWPLKMRFPQSRLYVSIFLPLSLGFGAGVLSGIMGIGGGFVLVPAMIYLMGMPTLMVIGTSAFQIVFVAANVTLLQSWHNHTVDLMLALTMLAGGVIGGPIGARVAGKLPSEQLRALLALLLVGISIKLFVDLVATPEQLYQLVNTGGAG
jgi:uncharacterized membrane protein YfcA